MAATKKDRFGETIERLEVLIASAKGVYKDYRKGDFGKTTPKKYIALLEKGMNTIAATATKGAAVIAAEKDRGQKWR